MKSLCVILSVVLCLAIVLPGCGMVDTPQQRALRHRQILDFQMRGLVDDIDYLLLLERNTYLTRFHPRVGN